LPWLARLSATTLQIKNKKPYHLNCPIKIGDLWVE
jgi:hypothetical protein